MIEHQSEMEIDDCFLADNSHSGIGGHGGGAVACDSSTVTIDSSTLVRNSSTSSGGAVSTRLSVVTIVGSMFGENQANVGGSDPFGGAGGAIFSDGLLSPLALTDCVFDRNSAGVGGAVAFGVLDMQGCQVLNNEARRRRRSVGDQRNDHRFLVLEEPCGSRNRDACFGRDVRSGHGVREERLPWDSLRRNLVLVGGRLTS